MSSLAGVAVDVGSLSGQLVSLVKEAAAEAGYQPAAPGTPCLRVRVGTPIGGWSLLSDSEVVTFDEGLAQAVVRRLGTRGALFAVRETSAGARAAFRAIEGGTRFGRGPKRPTHPGDVRAFVDGLGGRTAHLWPAPWELETRPGTTLALRPPKQLTLFPPRDTPARRADARRERDASMLLNLRPAHVTQWPAEGPCQTVSWWAPGQLPPHAEAVVELVHDPLLRAEAWASLAGDLWSRDLILDRRSLRLLAALEPDPQQLAKVKRHVSYQPVFRAVSWVVAHALGRPTPALDDEARFAAGRLALFHRRLDLVAALPLATLARQHLAAEGSDAIAAAALLAILEPDALAGVANTVTAHWGAHLSDLAWLSEKHLERMLAVVDLAQPRLAPVDSGSTDPAAWGQAMALWMTWRSLRAKRPSKAAREAAARRVERALGLAPTHAPTLHNAIVVLELLGDKAGARAAAKRLWGVDRRASILRRFPVR